MIAITRMIIFYLYYITVNNAQVISNDYAEVRVLLNQFHKMVARKYGFFHDYDPKKVSKELKNIPADDGTEASINREEGILGDLFENDIVLTLPQVQTLLNENKKGRNIRQAIRGTKYHWIETPISYQFADFDVKWQKSIRNALTQIEAETCIRFQENSHDRNHLYFIRGNGCWSNVGRTGNRQSVSIGIGCEKIGIVLHELLHALGLWHEQSRTDRDDYISINHSNIFPGTQGNFEKRTIDNTDNMDLSYDYGSVMHYGSKAFAIQNDRFTIETLDPDFQQTIGQRKGISFKDAKMINLRYCKKKCQYELNCYNGGYTDPNNCHLCKCPTGFGGNDCRTVEKSRTPKCGGTLFAEYNDQYITSDGLIGAIHCVWRIRSKGQVLVYIDELQLPCNETCTTYLELKFKTDMVPTGSRHCCNPPNKWIISETETFIIMYVGNILRRSGRKMGFRLRYRIYDSAPKITTTEESTTTATTTATTMTTTGKVTITPAATTTTTITTTESIVRSAWSDWGQWSVCSTTCGGCGKQRRIRACYGKKQYCPGPELETRACGEGRCPTAQNFNCVSRLVMPCSLYKHLQFATDKDAYIPPDDKLNVDQYKYKNYIKSTFSGERLCVKYFHYFCSKSTFDIYMSWKDDNDWKTFNKRGCCNHYHYDGKNCIPD